MSETSNFAEQFEDHIRAAIHQGYFDDAVRQRAYDMEIAEKDAHYARQARLEKLEKNRDRRLNQKEA